ncbi:MAG: T9SS type A sorting domain-containing protein [Rhodothermales bacterium]|nr:T9SS type A sorting domain-containing protein [Rhodothermales bacterium]
MVYSKFTGVATQVARGVFILCMMCRLVQAQTTELSYFPYSPGDSAVFNISYPGTHSVWVGGEFNSGEHDYVIVEGIQGRRSPDTMRVSNNQVIRIENGTEYVLYDFSLPDSSVYHVKEGAWPGADTFRVTIERRSQENVPAGTFDDCVRLHFDIPQYVDDEWSYSFCRGIGLVWHGGAWGGGTLEWASIGGVVITSNESVRRQNQEPQLYPNPASEVVTFLFPGRGESSRHVRVFDVLGRQLESYSIVARDESTVDVNVTGLSPGVYVARIEDAKAAFSRMFIVVR